LINVAKTGKWRYQIGDGKNLQDFTYVDNVAHAHLLASEKLAKGSGIEGEAFFITNDEPYPLWDMVKYCYSEMGYGEPYIKLPAILMWYMALLIDFIAWLISPLVTWHPNFTWFRVCNSVCYRYFKIDKAKRVLGYKPIVTLKQGMRRTLDYFKAIEDQNSKKAK